MKTMVKVALLFIQCLPFALQAHGLWIFNESGQDVQYRGNYSGIIQNRSHVHFQETPTLLSIKRGLLWTPLEMYLLKMHTQKKGMEDRKGNSSLVGNLYINSSGITSDICYRDVRGNKTN